MSHKAPLAFLQKSPLDQPRLNSLGTKYSWRGLNAWERKLGLELLLWTEGTRALTPYGGPTRPLTCLSAGTNPLQDSETRGCAASHRESCAALCWTWPNLDLMPAQEEGAVAWRRHSGSASVCGHWAQQPWGELGFWQCLVCSMAFPYRYRAALTPAPCVMESQGAGTCFTQHSATSIWHQ